MARPKNPIKMKNVCIRVPETLLEELKREGITDLSAQTEGFWQSLITLPVPQSQKKRDIQTSILEICEKLAPRRNIVREYFSPGRELDAETHIMNLLKERYAIAATPTDISVAMMNIQKVHGGCIAG